MITNEHIYETLGEIKGLCQAMQRDINKNYAIAQIHTKEIQGLKRSRAIITSIFGFSMALAPFIVYFRRIFGINGG